MALCHCRSDKSGHPHQPPPYWGPPEKVKDKEGKESEVQKMVGACPARGIEGKAKLLEPKVLRRMGRAMRRSSLSLAEHRAAEWDSK